jgi:cysteine synthase
MLPGASTRPGPGPGPGHVLEGPSQPRAAAGRGGAGAARSACREALARRAAALTAAACAHCGRAMQVAAEIICEALASGRLQPGGLVTEGTAGSTGVSLAMVARAVGCRRALLGAAAACCLGPAAPQRCPTRALPWRVQHHAIAGSCCGGPPGCAQRRPLAPASRTRAPAPGCRAHIVMPDDAAVEKAQVLAALGAQVERVRPVSITHPGHPVNMARRRAQQEPGCVFADQFENEANRWALRAGRGGLRCRQRARCTALPAASAAGWSQLGCISRPAARDTTDGSSRQAQHAVPFTPWLAPAAGPQAPRACLPAAQARAPQDRGGDLAAGGGEGACLRVGRRHWRHHHRRVPVPEGPGPAGAGALPARPPPPRSPAGLQRCPGPPLHSSTCQPWRGLRCPALAAAPPLAAPPFPPLRCPAGSSHSNAAAVGSHAQCSRVSPASLPLAAHPQVFLIDPPGSSLYNKVTRGVMYTRHEAEGRRLRNPFDTITEGIGINRVTANFSAAAIDGAFKGSDREAVEMAHYLVRCMHACTCCCMGPACMRRRALPASSCLRQPRGCCPRFLQSCSALLVERCRSLCLGPSIACSPLLGSLGGLRLGLRHPPPGGCRLLPGGRARRLTSCTWTCRCGTRACSWAARRP